MKVFKSNHVPYFHNESIINCFGQEIIACMRIGWLAIAAYPFPMATDTAVAPVLYQLFNTGVFYENK